MVLRAHTRLMGYVAGLGLLFAVASAAHAEITVEGTRAIYPAPAAEISVRLGNEGRRPALVQAWISDGGPEQKPEDSAAPFILDKPVFRLDLGKTHALRIRGIAAKAPVDDREHLYWLNVVDVPPREAGADENVVQLAIRFRMKLFYRPAGLGTPADPDGKVTMSRTERGIELRNAARHYFNIATMTVVSEAGERALDSLYLAPGETRTLALPEDVSGPVSQVRYQWVDDDGILHAETRTL
ncbi:fimbrial biogenesis chaperone [Stenotrophomonas maltophilia]|uniref:fimbrial biogenesis chaperone n=1 Tax=Stenotrophomonas maltophilia TaxID=40324 RepID=UPI0021ACA6F2|nr:molecular chaperone [Stenotrophomonas maltophilia]